MHEKKSLLNQNFHTTSMTAGHPLSKQKIWIKNSANLFPPVSRLKEKLANGIIRGDIPALHKEHFENESWQSFSEF
jgi:hypothetical protein